MKILHMMLSNFYIDGYNYQENALPRQNKADGHTVKIIASTFIYIENRESGYVEPSSYINEDGIPVIRLPFKNIISKGVSSKIRAFPGVYKLIDDFSPDVIFYHNVSGYELLTVAKYRKCHPNTKLYVDNHADYHNSANNILSKIILHKIFYKNIIKKSLMHIDKVFYLTYECKEFLENIYDIPENKLEYYPLGGDIICEDEYRTKRDAVRSSLFLEDNDILLIHSGKMDKLKRTIEILEAFSQVKNENLNLILLGTLSKDIEEEVKKLIDLDNRVKFLGWQKPEQMFEFLCAADLYLQPGGQSVTMQNALCCNCAVAVYPHKSHKYLLGDSAFYVETIKDIEVLLNTIVKEPTALENKRRLSYEIACKILDYKILARRLYH